MTNDGNDTIADAADIIAIDDAESSTQTIIERPGAEKASKDGGGNDQAIMNTADEFPSPAPKSSRITEICYPPSTKRSLKSVVYIKRLHNDVAERPSNLRKQGHADTKRLHLGACSLVAMSEMQGEHARIFKWRWPEHRLEMFYVPIRRTGATAADR
jgi:hypothetical protein